MTADLILKQCLMRKTVSRLNIIDTILQRPSDWWEVEDLSIVSRANLRSVYNTLNELCSKELMIKRMIKGTHCHQFKLTINTNI